MDLADMLGKRISDADRDKLLGAARDMDEVLQAVLESYPKGTRAMMGRTARNAAVRIGPRSVGDMGDSYIAVSEDDIEVLAVGAMTGNYICCMCLRTGIEVRKCPLRPVLRRLYEAHDSRYGMCGYAGLTIQVSDKYKRRQEAAK